MKELSMCLPLENVYWPKLSVSVTVSSHLDRTTDLPSDAVALKMTIPVHSTVYIY